jgi:hypothetical protein
MVKLSPDRHSTPAIGDSVVIVMRTILGGSDPGMLAPWAAGAATSTHGVDR